MQIPSKFAVGSVLLLGGAGWAVPARACSGCVPVVHATALGPGFATTLGLLLLPVLVIAAVAVAVHGLARRRAGH